MKIKIAPFHEKIIKSSITQSMANSGINVNTVIPTIKSALEEGRVNPNRYLRGTSLFWDYGWIFGLRTEKFDERLRRDNPSIRDVIDFYTEDRITTMGNRPLETLFLKVHWDKYGLTEAMRINIESDIRENIGALGYAMLIDTMNFVMTGERDLPIPLLVGYMNADTPANNLIVKERFDRNELSRLSSEEFLTRWISTKTGMYDCITMQRLLYRL